MAVIITIGGIDRTGEVQNNTAFKITQNLTYSGDSCSFEVISDTAPTRGQEVIIADDGVKLFCGILDKVVQNEQPGGIRIFNCDARDYMYLLDSLLVIERYTNQPADAIVLDILARYCHGFTSNNVSFGAPLVEDTGENFYYKHPSECIKWLCDYVGWSWYVDYDKDVHFFYPDSASRPAPIAVNNTTASTIVRNFNVDIDITGMANRIYVRGGTMLSDPQSLDWIADGAARQWPLPYTPNEATLSVNGVPKSVGIENTNEDDGSYDYFVNLNNKYLKCASSVSAPAAGSIMSMTIRDSVPVITMVEDQESQAAIAAAIPGSTGIFEDVVNDESITTIEAAEAAGYAELKLRGNPTIKGQFDNSTPGWAPGQVLSIDLPDKGLQAEYTVQKVTITTRGTGWNYKVEFGGRLKGIADTLKAILSAQQNQKNTNINIISKIKIMTDVMAAADQATITHRGMPYRCGDSDAYCGETCCDNGGDFAMVGPGLWVIRTEY